MAAVILSGAVLEGILTFAMMRRESEATDAHQGTNCKSKHRIPEWRLEELIEVAVKLKLLGRSASEVAPVVRDFRNMIHPYRLLKRSKPRWDALAPLALAAVAEISRSLGGRIQTG